jgi:hypothetical protein
MIYQSSKGAVEVSTMPLSYAKNALNKLRRTEPERTEEIDAIAAHVEALEAEATAKSLAGDGANPRAVVGGNNPPPDDPAPKLDGRAAVDAHVADLLAEARNWADGAAIENQDQADAVGRLHRMLQQAVGLVDGAATEEKRPHNKAIDEIATWQNGYTAKGLKKTPDGSLTKAVLATTNLSGAWLRKLDDERRERERVAAEAARAAARDAITIREEAKASTDLEAMDKAADALADARALLREAEGVAKEKVRVGGGDGFRAMSLRSVWSAEITDKRAALLYFLNTHRDRFDQLAQTLADEAARNEATRRPTPGVVFHEEKRAA